MLAEVYAPPQQNLRAEARRRDTEGTAASRHVQEPHTPTEVDAAFPDATSSLPASKRLLDEKPPPIPQKVQAQPQPPAQGTMIYLRRSDDHGNVPLLAHTFPVAEHWVYRLVRCEVVDFTHQRSRFYAMRRRDPHHQPSLREVPIADRRFPILNLLHRP